MNFLSRQTPFVNTTWVVAHHPFASWESNWRLNPQQTFKLETLFAKGVRGFMIDIHYHEGDIYICHEHNAQKQRPGNCWDTKWLMLASPVKLDSLLANLYNLIIKNPDDIIMLFLECYVPMQEVAALFAQNNLTQFLLKTNPNTQHITIGDMLTNNTPLIVFSDYAHGRQELIEGMLYTKNYRESKYNLAEYQGCEDRGEMSRTKYNEGTYGSQVINLFLLNHFYQTSITFPGTLTYYEINNYNHIKDRSVKCQKEFSLFPNFIAVDYVEQGNWGGVFAFVNEQNYKTLCAFTNNDCTSVHLDSLVGKISNDHHHDEL
jgi:hypothetical protein